MIDNTLRATSVRLSPECLTQMGEMVTKTGLSRSDVIRRGVKLMYEAANTDGSHRLAVIDASDKRGAEYFRVAEWIDQPVP